MSDIPTFEDFCADGELLGEPISKAWATLYAAVEGLPLDEEGEALFRQCTGRDTYTPRVYNQVTAICGRRSEKTSSALKYLIWKALFAGWEKHGSWIRRATRTARRLRVPLIAQDLRVANDMLRTAEQLCLDSPVVSEEIDDVRVHEIIFKNGVSLICLPASKASVRGLSVPACLLDELAWVSIEGASDRELVRQVKPAMIQFGAARRLIKQSTPWQNSGVIFDDFAHRAERPDVLCWQASTATMTPRIDREELERERLADPAYFAREYEASFATSDLQNFLSGADIAAAVRAWRELSAAPEPFYIAALDASGLTGGDRFTFGIASSDSTGTTVSVLRGWRKATVGEVLDEIASLCRQFRIQDIEADQYSYTFLAELLRQRGVKLSQLAFTARSKPELYFDLKNSLSQGKLSLPDHPDMVRELRALEALRTSGGAYKIGAPRGQHDDYVTVLALLANRIKRAAEKHLPIFCFIPFSERPAPGTIPPPTAAEQAVRDRLWEERCFAQKRGPSFR